jgi:hypothetical protein
MCSKYYNARACSRWYFTFDGAECTNPATIEGIVYVEFTSENPSRHRHIEGYCNEVPKGRIRVGLWIGRCGGHRLGDGNSGWGSTSRIIVEEVPPPQT